MKKLGAKISRLKNEKGSVVIFAVCSMMLFLSVTASTYIYNTNKLAVQKQQIAEIKKEYEVSELEQEQKYDEIIGDSEDIISITLDGQGGDMLKATEAIYRDGKKLYLDENIQYEMTTKTNPIIAPSKGIKITYEKNAEDATVSPNTVFCSYEFLGYYDSVNENATQIINKSGYIAESYNTDEYTFSNSCLYAKWENTVSTTLPEPIRQGYTFEGWYSEESLTNKVGNAGDNYIPEQNITLYAKWTIKQYTLTYNANGGTVEPTSKTGNYNEEITLPTPTRTYTITYNTNGGSKCKDDTVNYTFNGWYTQSTGGIKKTYTTMPANNETLYAQWTANSIELPTLTRTGYTFEGWYVDESLETKVTLTEGKYAPTENITLYAKWTIEQYTLTYNANGGIVEPTSKTGNYNEEITLPTPTRTYTIAYNTNGGSTCKDDTVNYTFNGWYTQATGGTKKTYTTMPANNETLYAQWTANSIELPTLARTGYTFEGWYVDESLETKVTLTEGKYAPTENITLYAKWTIKQYTLTYNVNGGTVESTSNTANYNEKITLPTPVRTGYTFEGWYVDEKLETAVTLTDGKYILTENITLYAKWTEIKATGLTIDKTTDSIEYGKTTTITATIIPSDTLNKNINWITSDSSICSLSSTISTTGDAITLTAKKVGTATITATAADGSGKTASCVVTVTKPISDCEVTLSNEIHKYDGKEKTFKEILVKDEGTTLAENTNYTVSYSNNLNAGTAIVTITGKGYYTGEKAIDFEIYKAYTKLVVNPEDDIVYVGDTGKFYVKSSVKGIVTITSENSNIIFNNRNSLTSGSTVLAENQYMIKYTASAYVKEKVKIKVSLQPTDSNYSEAEAEYTVQVKDKAGPTVTLTKSTDSSTNGNIILTGVAQDSDSGIVGYKFSKDGSSSSTWNNITATTEQITKTYEVTENGIYYFYAIDDVGNISSASVEVLNIDKTLPDVIISTNGGKYTLPNDNGVATENAKISSIVNATDDGSDIATLEYTWTTTTTEPTSGWQTFTNGSKIEKKDCTQNTYYLWIKAVDGAGNETIVCSEGFAVALDLITFTVSPTTPTNGNVTVNINYGESLTENKEIKDEITSYSSTITTITLNENRKIQSRATDIEGNEVTASKNITNIDKIAPTVSVEHDNNQIYFSTFPLSNRPSWLGDVTHESYEEYYFVNEGSSIVSNNSFLGEYIESIAESYIKIDLSSYSESKSFEISINADISSEEDCDIGFATITNSQQSPVYGSSDQIDGDIFMFISGETSGNYYTSLMGGQEYYLHIGYSKDNSYDEGTDSLHINSISIKETNSITATRKLNMQIIAEDEGTSGLSDSNNYQYYLSTSSTSLAGGSWTDYTNGEVTTIGEGKKGTYYLYVKTVSDNAGNVSNKKGNIVTISGVNYHKFGPYVFDSTTVKPDITLKEKNSTGNTYMSGSWTNKNIYHEINTDNSVSVDKYQYTTDGGSTWKDIVDSSLLRYSTTSLGSSSSVLQSYVTLGISGDYSFEVNSNGGIYSTNNTYYQSDNMDETIAHGFIQINLGSYSTSDKFDITINAKVSSEYSDYGYAIISSSPIDVEYDFGEPIEKQPEGVFMCISGEESGNYSYELTGGSTYYLNFIYEKDESNSDGDDMLTINSISITQQGGSTSDGLITEINKAGNKLTYMISKATDTTFQIRPVYIGGTKGTSSDKFNIKIEKTVPTISVSPTSDTTVSATKEIIITNNDTGGSGVTNMGEYYLSTSNTSLSGGEWISYISGRSNTIGNGITGTRYLWIKPIQDNAGNVSKSTYHIFGTYVFDYVAPTCTITAETRGGISNEMNVVAYIVYTFTFSEDVTGFTSDDITVTNGEKVNFSGSGKTYTLAVKNELTKTSATSVTQTISVPAGACQTSYGVSNKAANSKQTFKKVTAKFIDYSGITKTTRYISGVSYNGNGISITAPEINTYTGWSASNFWRTGTTIANAGTELKKGKSLSIYSDITFYTIYTKQTTVSYDLNGGEGEGEGFREISTPSSVYLSKKFNSYDISEIQIDTTTLPSFEYTNMIFDGWYTEEGVLVGEEGTTYEAPDQSITLYAHWLGDVDGDGYTTTADALMISQVIINLRKNINKENADINGDGEITAEDNLEVLKFNSYLGDVNLDGGVTEVDILEISKAIEGITDLTEEQKRRADVNFDGVIDEKDKSEIVNSVTNQESIIGATRRLMGDVDLNGEESAEDAMLVSKYIESLATLNAYQKVLADMNFDGVIDSSDVELILKGVSNIIE